MRWMLLLEDEHLSRARMFVASLAPGERIALEGERIAGPRGTCGPSRVVVSSTAPFGVGRARIVLEPDGTTTVLPAWTRLDDPGVRSSPPATGLARRSRNRPGTGPEYLGIREYRWGDSMRHVHWPSTARTGAVMVREFEEELRASLAIVVDTFGDVGADDGAERARELTPMDRACSVAASIALTSIEEGLTVRLAAAVAGGVDVLDDADPHRVLRWLAELPGAGGILDQRALALGLDLLHLLRALPEEQVGADGGAEHGHDQGGRVAGELQARRDGGPGHLQPGRMDREDHGHIGEQGQGQPLQEADIAVVRHEDLQAQGQQLGCREDLVDGVNGGGHRLSLSGWGDEKPQLPR